MSRVVVVVLALALSPAALGQAQTEEEARTWCHERGEAFSCTQLGMRYLTGELPADDPIALAVPLLEKGCEGGHANGCYNLGVAYERGMVPGRTMVDALPLYLRACELGDGAACPDAIVLLLNGDKKAGIVADLPAALVPGRTGCDLGDGWSCYFLAAQHYEGWGTPRDYAVAADLAGKACGRGVPPGCKLQKKAAKKAG